LQSVPCVHAFWFAWVAFHPGSVVVAKAGGGQ
jgi:hypothetical protein